MRAAMWDVGSGVGALDGHGTAGTGEEKAGERPRESLVWVTKTRHTIGIDPIPERSMSELHRITVNPNQCGGRPCIRGLRVRVADILDMLAAGAGRDDILRDYPYLEDGDITAALEFAARQSDHPVLHAA
jgi:uncharacterized protein (DUF433 family)